jgi:TfoX/Sxy family transcriptional regulator of competence genes
MRPEVEDLAARIRATVGIRPGVTEKKMFGGFGFMLNGNMFVGVMATGELLVRVAPGDDEAILARPGVAPMMMGERRMKGFVGVTDEGIESDERLAGWIAYAEAHVRTMPPK